GSEYALTLSHYMNGYGQGVHDGGVDVAAASTARGLADVDRLYALEILDQHSLGRWLLPEGLFHGLVDLAQEALQQLLDVLASDVAEDSLGESLSGLTNPVR